MSLFDAALDGDDENEDVISRPTGASVALFVVWVISGSLAFGAATWALVRRCWP